MNKKNKLTMFARASDKWKTHPIFLDAFVKEVDDGMYNMEPEHQRTDEVHTNVWCCEVLHTMIYKGYVSPSMFDTIERPDGTIYRRSIDGKQRCMAPYRYMKNKYEYTLSEPAEMKGKKFSQLDEVTKQRFSKMQLLLAIKCDEIHKDDVSDYYDKLQDTKRTTKGEFLKSKTSCPLRKEFDRLLEIEKFKNAVLDINDNFSRSNEYAIFANITYLCYNPGAKSVEKKKVEKNFISKTLSNEEDEHKLASIVSCIVRIAQLNRKYSEKVSPFKIHKLTSEINYCSLAKLFFNNNNSFTKLINFIDNELTNGREVTLVPKNKKAGDLSALRYRYEFIQNLINDKYP